MSDDRSYNYLTVLPYSKNVKPTPKPMSVEEIMYNLKTIESKADYLNLNENFQQFLKKISNILYDKLLFEKINVKEYGKIKSKLTRLTYTELELAQDKIIEMLSNDNVTENIIYLTENFARLRSFACKMLNYLDPEYDIETVKLILQNNNFKELLYRTYDSQFNYLDDKPNFQDLHDINKKVLISVMYDKKILDFKIKKQSNDVVRTFYLNKNVDIGNYLAMTTKKKYSYNYK